MSGFGNVNDDPSLRSSGDFHQEGISQFQTDKELLAEKAKKVAALKQLIQRVGLGYISKWMIGIQLSSVMQDAVTAMEMAQKTTPTKEQNAGEPAKASLSPNITDTQEAHNQRVSKDDSEKYVVSQSSVDAQEKLDQTQQVFHLEKAQDVAEAHTHKVQPQEMQHFFPVNDLKKHDEPSLKFGVDRDEFDEALEYSKLGHPRALEKLSKIHFFDENAFEKDPIGYADKIRILATQTKEETIPEELKNKAFDPNKPLILDYSDPDPKNTHKEFKELVLKEQNKGLPKEKQSEKITAEGLVIFSKKFHFYNSDMMVAETEASMGSYKSFDVDMLERGHQEVLENEAKKYSEFARDYMQNLYGVRLSISTIDGNGEYGVFTSYKNDLGLTDSKDPYREWQSAINFYKNEAQTMRQSITSINYELNDSYGNYDVRGLNNVNNYFKNSVGSVLKGMQQCENIQTSYNNLVKAHSEQDGFKNAKAKLIEDSEEILKWIDKNPKAKNAYSIKQALTTVLKLAKSKSISEYNLSIDWFSAMSIGLDNKYDTVGTAKIQSIMKNYESTYKSFQTQYNAHFQFKETKKELLKEFYQNGIKLFQNDYKKMIQMDSESRYYNAIHGIHGNLWEWWSFGPLYYPSTAKYVLQVFSEKLAEFEKDGASGMSSAIDSMKSHFQMWINDYPGVMKEYTYVTSEWAKYQTKLGNAKAELANAEKQIRKLEANPPKQGSYTILSSYAHVLNSMQHLHVLVSALNLDESGFNNLSYHLHNTPHYVSTAGVWNYMKSIMNWANKVSSEASSVSHTKKVVKGLKWVSWTAAGLAAYLIEVHLLHEREKKLEEYRGNLTEAKDSLFSYTHFLMNRQRAKDRRWKNEFSQATSKLVQNIQHKSIESRRKEQKDLRTLMQTQKNLARIEETLTKIAAHKKNTRTQSFT